MSHLTRGFVQIRRGFIEHVRTGRVPVAEGSLFLWLLLEADPRTGIVYGSAGFFASAYSGWPARNVREWLEGLEKKGYIKRFSKPGSHASYPILIDKYLCTDGAMKGKRLNATASTSCTAPVYESCEEDGKDIAGDLARTLPQEERKRIEKRKDSFGTHSVHATLTSSTSSKRPYVKPYTEDDPMSSFAVTDGHRRFARDRGLPPPEWHVEEFCSHWRRKGIPDNWDADAKFYVRMSRHRNASDPQRSSTPGYLQ